MHAVTQLNETNKSTVRHLVFVQVSAFRKSEDTSQVSSRPDDHTGAVYLSARV